MSVVLIGTGTRTRSATWED